jgi:hypothetical protein
MIITAIINDNYYYNYNDNYYYNYYHYNNQNNANENQIVKNINIS